jgi:hypothetical protein
MIPLESYLCAQNYEELYTGNCIIYQYHYIISQLYLCTLLGYLHSPLMIFWSAYIVSHRVDLQRLVPNEED